MLVWILTTSTVIVCNSGSDDIDTEDSPFTLEAGAVVACGTADSSSSALDFTCTGCDTAIANVAMAPTPMISNFAPASAC